MRICPNCGRRFEASGWRCPACSFEPPIRDEARLFAEDAAAAGEGFDPAAFELLARLEPGSYWFEVRNQLITWALGNYFPGARDYLEIGCGTGFVLSGVHKAAPHLRLTGTELYSEGLAYARRRVPDAELAQMDARDLPYDKEFDVIGAFDVLEHIEEDEAVMHQIHAALRPGGGMLLTVPQHPWLWSPNDEVAMHCRRYSRRELTRKVRGAGFKIERTTSFVSLLLPLMALSRLRKRHSESAIDSEFAVGRTTNTALTAVLRFELALIRLGISLPAGGSLLLAARKSPGASH